MTTCLWRNTKSARATRGRFIFDAHIDTTQYVNISTISIFILMPSRTKKVFIGGRI